MKEAAQHALLTIIAQVALILPSHQEEEFALTALIHALLATAQELALVPSAVSITSRDPAKLPALLEPAQLMESVNALLESFLQVNVSLLADQDSLQLLEAANHATLTAQNAQVQ